MGDLSRLYVVLGIVGLLGLGGIGYFACSSRMVGGTHLICVQEDEKHFKREKKSCLMFVAQEGICSLMGGNFLPPRKFSDLG